MKAILASRIKQKSIYSFKRLSENYDLGMRGDLNSREKQL